MTILVVGTGSIGTRHAANLQALGRRVERLSMRVSGLDGALARIAAGGLAGVVVATATQLRLPLIAASAAQGLPVYVEKPLAFGVAELAAIEVAAAPVAARSMLGLMMRYHPSFRELVSADLSDTWWFSFDIGHDVTQWRSNWRFSDSYAARADGGGVLLDLCHELDMAVCLFPGAVLGAVESIGHVRYPGVDMATRISFGGVAQGSVSMDYLSPVSTRRIDIAGIVDRRVVDLLAVPFERNQMFLAAMRDWLALIDGQGVSGVEHLPRLDLVGHSCRILAQTWAARRFVGELAGDKP